VRIALSKAVDAADSGWSQLAMVINTGNLSSARGLGGTARRPVVMLINGGPLACY